MEEKMENTCPHCSSCNKKVRDEKEYKDMMNRLSRIEGQGSKAWWKTMPIAWIF